MRPFLLKLIYFYQKTISPDHGLLVRPTRVCRFYPSCSEYAAGTIEKHSAVKAGWLILRRLLKCRPFNPGGWDPIP